MLVSEEYFVTFEKDTEIIHQHVLRTSHQVGNYNFSKTSLYFKISIYAKLVNFLLRLL
jgi:hypothetical protein